MPKPPVLKTHEVVSRLAAQRVPCNAVNPFLPILIENA
jgi:hypothetical protein